jgi:peptidyl-dipeptidase Dcp
MAPCFLSSITKATMSLSILLQPWEGKYGGVPPWQSICPEDFPEAFDVAIDEARNEIREIADSTEPATFENTMEPLERSGATLDRLQAMFGVHAGNLNLGPIPEMESQVAQKLSAWRDSVIQNEKLFARIKQLRDSDDFSSLSSVQQRLVDERFKSFVRSGASLSTKEKEQLTKINTTLADLYTQFSQNVLADEGNYATWIEDERRLAGLPESVIASMSAEAEANDQPGKWAVANTRSSVEPFLAFADDRDLRESVWRTLYGRCDHGDEYDNKDIITKILKLRAERAKLLGYSTHAHWRLEPQMAKTPDAAMELMMNVWPKSVARVREEVADMQAIADSQGDEIKIEPWDYRYYAEKVRAAKYDRDFNQVKPYLQLHQLVEGMMWAATQVFELKFLRVSDVPVFHPDVEVWQVLDREGGEVGLFYLDPYARKGKRSGAWMTSYRDQHRMGQSVTPIVSNNSNFIRAEEGQPVLISWDDATTLFHEFGHALHGLLSNVTWPSQSGTNVSWDFVEFPSQVFEHWLSTPEVLKKFATHYQTGDSIPQELLDKIEKAATFNQGFGTVEFLASALMDMKLHLAGDVTIDPAEFEQKTLAELGMPAEMVMRHRLPHFSHVFSGDGYSAGYYSYLWADALTADAAEAFEEAGSFYDRELGTRLLETVFSVGDTVDPAASFRRFRGRDVDTSALLRKRGFPAESA